MAVSQEVSTVISHKLCMPEEIIPPVELIPLIVFLHC